MALPFFFTPFPRSRMRFARFVVAALAVALTPSLAGAQSAASPPPADAAAVTDAEIQLATRLMELMDIQGISATAVRTMLNAQMEINPEMEPFREVLEQWALDLFHQPEVLEQYARLYAGRFTESELRDLVVFYESPTGRRMAAEQPALIEGGEEIGRWLAEEGQGELMRMLQDAMEKGAGARTPKRN
jgi:uncharacterized protein